MVHHPEHALIASQYLLDELDRILRYPRLQRLHGFDDDEIKRFVNSVGTLAAIVMLEHVEAVTTADVDDDPIVATAVVGQADVLCTRDNDLFAESVIAYCFQHNIRVLTDVQLLQELKAQDTSDR